MRWIMIVGCLALLVVCGFQWRSISQLRRENSALRDRSQDALLETALAVHASATPETIDSERLQEDRLELLRLRNEVRQLRELALSHAVETPIAASSVATPNPPVVQSASEDPMLLAVAAMRGDAGALEKLANVVTTIRTMNTDEQAAARSNLRSAFQMLGTEAGKGNASALQTLWQASRITGLQGLATEGLGQAAALGNDEALKPLLEPEAYLLLRSSAVSALKPAADAGNERAIQALAATAADPEQKALWLLATHGLEGAAAAGNPTAIDGLASIATSTNQSIRKEAVLALEAAARNQHSQAEQALRNLGWR